MEDILNCYNNLFEDIKKIMSQVENFKSKLKDNQQDLSTNNLQPKRSEL